MAPYEGLRKDCCIYVLSVVMQFVYSLEKKTEFGGGGGGGGGEGQEQRDRRAKF